MVDARRPNLELLLFIMGRIGIYVDAVNVTMNGGYGMRYDVLRKLQVVVAVLLPVLMYTFLTMKNACKTIMITVRKPSVFVICFGISNTK